MKLPAKGKTSRAIKWASGSKIDSHTQRNIQTHESTHINKLTVNDTAHTPTHSHTHTHTQLTLVQTKRNFCSCDCCQLINAVWDLLQQKGRGKGKRGKGNGWRGKGKEKGSMVCVTTISLNYKQCLFVVYLCNVSLHSLLPPSLSISLSLPPFLILSLSGPAAGGAAHRNWVDKTLVRIVVI